MSPGSFILERIWPKANQLTQFKDELRPQDGMSYAAMVNAEAWVQDFTHLWYEQSFCYLAVVLSLKTRQVVGWRLGTSHSSELTTVRFWTLSANIRLRQSCTVTKAANI